MRTLRAACCLVVLVLACPIRAQQVSQRDPQAVAVLQRCLAAMGGTSAAAVQDSVVQGTSLLSQNAATPVTIKTKGPDRMRWDTALGGKPSAVVMNRGQQLQQTEKGWRSGPSPNAVNARPHHLPGLMLAYELARKDSAASFVGTETLNNRQVQHVKLVRVSAVGNPDMDAQLAKNSTLDIFVDAQSFMITKISYLQVSETDWRRSLPVDIYYADYRSISGMAVPVVQSTYFNGKAAGVLHIISVALNSGVADTEFVGRP